MKGFVMLITKTSIASKATQVETTSLGSNKVTEFRPIKGSTTPIMITPNIGEFDITLVSGYEYGLNTRIQLDEKDLNGVAGQILKQRTYTCKLAFDVFKSTPILLIQPADAESNIPVGEPKAICYAIVDTIDLELEAPQIVDVHVLDDGDKYSRNCIATINTNAKKQAPKIIENIEQNLIELYNRDLNDIVNEVYPKETLNSLMIKSPRLRQQVKMLDMLGSDNS